MKRFLSHIVLFALLVISPVSFSTAEIPNFDILVTVSSPVQESRKAGITVSRRVVQAVPLTAVSRSLDTCIILLPTLPAIDNIREIEHGRAPPFYPSA